MNGELGSDSIDDLAQAHFREPGRYSPETNKLFVASAKGKVYIYEGTSFALITSIDFHGLFRRRCQHDREYRLRFSLR